MQLLTRNEALEFVRQRRAVLDAAAGGNPFAGSAWTEHFLAGIATDDWTIAVPGDEAGFMLLYHERGQPRRLSALANYYASLYSPLVSTATDRGAAMAAVVADLARARPRPVAVNLAPLDGESADTAALADAWRAQGWYAKRYFCFGNWYMACEGLSFADYMATRDSRLFNTWTRKAKKFRSGADGARLELVTDPAGVDAAMDAYERIYARSWKVPEPHPGFIRGWAHICARNGWLRLGLAWLGDVPIAAQFWFTLERRAYIFKLAYDEEHAKLSAGTVLSAMLFEHSLERDRVVEMDYLTGDDAYKRSWMNARRERVGVLACNLRTPRGLALAAMERAGELRRRLAPPAAAPAPVT